MGGSGPVSFVSRLSRMTNLVANGKNIVGQDDIQNIYWDG